MDSFDDMFVGRKSLLKEDKKNDPNAKTTTTIYGRVQDIQRIDNLVWLITHHNYEKATRGTVIEDSIALLATEMDYAQLSKKYETQLAAAKAKVGRRSNKKGDSEDDKMSISIYTTRGNVKLLDDLVWLREHALLEKASRGTVIEKSLVLLSDKYQYDSLAKKYRKHLPFP